MAEGTRDDFSAGRCTWCGLARPTYPIRVYCLGWMVARICDACARRDGIDPLWAA